jgi:hypothetical protein
VNFHNIDKWAVILVIVVSLQTTLIAYLYAPKWKAMMLSFPFPFTFATLSIGHGVDATSVAGLFLSLIFTHVVRIFHYRLRIPILFTIAICAVGYCLIGSISTLFIPKTAAVFWTSSALIFALGLYLYFTTPLRKEQGHRTPLPIWLKLPILIFIILSIFLLKNAMQGFAAAFPMVGVITAYEARHSLWTICRQMPVILITMLLLMAICRLTQSSLGLGAGLALGWTGLLVVLFVLVKNMWAKDNSQFMQEQENAEIE